MQRPLSSLGLTLALCYAALCAILLATQGIFGESFIVLILGLPWSMLPAAFEYGNPSDAMLYALVFLPLVVNAAILYWIGGAIQRRRAH